MDQKKRQALLVMALNILYVGVQLLNGPNDLTPTKVSICIIIAFVGAIFALNIKEGRWRWPLITLNIIFACLIAYLYFIIH